MNTRLILVTVWLAFGVTSLAGDRLGDDRLPLAESTPPLSGSRPDIVVVMTDDLDWTTLYAARVLGLMPNLDAFIGDLGTTFTRSFVTNSVCCPSRASYLTGQYTHNHRTYSNQRTNGAVIAFDDTSTVATWLQAAGYRTAYVGKYLTWYGAFPTVYAPDELERATPPSGWRTA